MDMRFVRISVFNKNASDVSGTPLRVSCVLTYFIAPT